jgi:aspartate kinase
MARIVMKFGGTSVGDLDRIRNVARRIAKKVREGNEVTVVVSAMAGETNRLIELAHSLSENPVPREVDVLVSTGEQVSIALVAIALNDLGIRARSFLGYQALIRTDSRYLKARIQEIDPAPILSAIKEGEVPVIAGFQGIDEYGNITTLGRGGSDLTAVAIAYAISADVCEIYTDVEGVFTADPNIVPNARKIHRISYDEMLELASLGAKVLQTRSVEMAKKYRVPIHVRSSFTDSEGTWVTEEVPEMEKILVSGVTYSTNEAKISLIRVPDRPGIAARVFQPLAERQINVDMIIQNVSVDGTTDLTFTVAQGDLKPALEELKKIEKEIGWKEIRTDTQISKVSIVGVGMRSHSGVAAKMFEVLARNGINIQMISTSEIKISVVIDRKYTELAVRELHEAFEL